MQTHEYVEPLVRSCALPHMLVGVMPQSSSSESLRGYSDSAMCHQNVCTQITSPELRVFEFLESLFLLHPNNQIFVHLYIFQSFDSIYHYTEECDNNGILDTHSSAGGQVFLGAGSKSGSFCFPGERGPKLRAFAPQICAR